MADWPSPQPWVEKTDQEERMARPPAAHPSLGQWPQVWLPRGEGRKGRERAWLLFKEERVWVKESNPSLLPHEKVVGEWMFLPPTQ